jgi:hypothetical protein
VNRITTSLSWCPLKWFVFRFLWFAIGHTSLVHAWQGLGPDAWNPGEPKPPVAYGGSPSLGQGDLFNGTVAITSPMLLGGEASGESTSPLVQIAQAPHSPEFTSLQLGAFGEIIDEGLVTRSTDVDPLGATQQIIYDPALPIIGSDGNLYLRPAVKIQGMNSLATSVYPSSPVPNRLMENLFEVDERAFESMAQDPSRRLSNSFDRAAAYGRNERYGNTYRPRRRSRDLGLGHERLAFALSEITASQPFNNIRLRSDFQYGWHFPNRAEYLWAGPSKGPKIPETGLDLQEYSVLMEVGTKSFSVGTELPLIWLNPSLNPNTSGFGDMSVSTKLVVLNGQSLQLTQLTRIHMPTGQASSGRGNGHVSMEPGLIAGYIWDDKTMFHGLMTLLFPIGGDPNFSGEILNYSFGIARVWYDGDQFAIIPTLESINCAVLSGAKGIEQNKISGDYISNLHPGVRFVFDRGGDLGLFEAGLGTGFSLTNNHFYESLIRFDLRWSY